MGILHICGKWKLEVKGNSETAAVEIGGERAVRHETRLAHLSHNSWAFYTLTKRIRGVNSVIDYCAGLGMWATIILHELEPKKLILNDIDEACANHLKEIFSPGVVTVRHGSYFSVIEEPFDLVCMDITIHTAKRSLVRDPGKLAPEIPLLKILKLDPKYVIISDCAAGKLHLNKKCYEEVLGANISDYDEYLTAFSRYLFSTSKYFIDAVVKCGNRERPHSSYLLLKKGIPDAPWEPIHDLGMAGGYRDSWVESTKPFALGDVS